MALSASRPLTLDYDVAGDVLYASLGEPQAALSVEVELDVILRYVPPTREVIGITFLNFRQHFPVFDPTHALSDVMGVVEEFVRTYPTVPLAIVSSGGASS